MIKLGVRLDWLGSELLSWRDLKVIVKHLPTDSAVGRQAEPELWRWDLNAYLTAVLINKVGNFAHVVTHQRGKYKAEITPPKPKRKISREPDRKVRRVKGGSITEIDEWLAKRRAAGKL